MEESKWGGKSGKRSRPRRRQRQPSQPPAGQRLVEGVFLPLSMGQNAEQRGGKRVSHGENCSDESKRMETKDEERIGTDPWEGMVESWEELSLYTQIELREDYLKRLKQVCLPLVDSVIPCSAVQRAFLKDARDTADIVAIVELVDLYRSVSVEVVENICKHREKTRGETFLFHGDNYLLRMAGDMDFASHVPELRTTYKLESFQRNPFVLKRALPLPNSRREAQDVVCAEYSREERAYEWVAENVARVKAAVAAIVLEERIHGVRPVPVSGSVWRELDERARRELEEGESFLKCERQMVPRLAKVIAGGGHNMNCFRRNDKDGDGMLMYHEFLKAITSLKCLEPPMSSEEQNWMIAKADPDGAGWISYHAFDKVCLWARDKLLESSKSGSARRGKSRPLVSSGDRSGDRLRDLAIPQFNDQGVPLFAYHTQYCDALTQECRQEIESIRGRRLKLQAELEQVRKELVESQGGGSSPASDPEDFTSLMAAEAAANRVAAETPLRARIASNEHARPRVEYPKQNLKRLEKLIGDLTTWAHELEDAIAALFEKERLEQEKKDMITSRERFAFEVQRSSAEEKIMRALEDVERARAKAALDKEREAARQVARLEHKEWEAEQRQKRKLARRQELLQRKSAAECLQRAFRCSASRLELVAREVAKARISVLVRESKLFSSRDSRLTQRPSPLLVVLAESESGWALGQQISQLIPGGFFAAVHANGVRSGLLPELRHAFGTSFGVLLYVAEDGASEDLARAVRTCAQALLPRVVCVDARLSQLSSHKRVVDERSLAWTLNAVAESIAQPPVLVNEELSALQEASEPYVLVARAICVLTGDHRDPGGTCWSSLKDELRDPERLLCRLLSLRPSVAEKKNVVDQLQPLLASTAWPPVDYSRRPALSLLVDWVYASALLLDPGTVSAMRPQPAYFGHALSCSAGIDGAVDQLVHLALIELRVHQHHNVTFFRLGPDHLVLRSLDPEAQTPVVYRVLDSDHLAALTVASSPKDKRKQMEISDLLERINIKHSSRLGLRESSPVENLAQGACQLPLINGEARWRGWWNGAITLLDGGQQKGGLRMKVTRFSIAPPFPETQCILNSTCPCGVIEWLQQSDLET